MLHEPEEVTSDRGEESAGTNVPAVPHDGTDIYSEVVRLQSRGEMGALATIVKTTGSTPGKAGMKLLVTESGRLCGTIGGGCVEAEVWEEAKDVMRSGVPRVATYRLDDETLPDEGLVCGGEIQVFIEPISPPTLFIFGGGHISKVLARIAQIVGFRIEVADDREEYVSKERFPDAVKRRSGSWDDVFSKIEIGPSAYVVVVTRGHQHDAEVVRRLSRFRPRYLGMVGSRRKARIIYDALAAEGIDRSWLESIASPVGLEIGARTHEEICVSIVAQMVQVRRGTKSREPENDSARS